MSEPAPSVQPKVSPRAKQSVRKPYAVGVKRRKQILQAALEVFSVQGYRGAPMTDIADKVGLTLAGVLHYFPSKEELLAAVLERRDRGLTPWFLQKWEETGSFSQSVHELMVRKFGEALERPPTVPAPRVEASWHAGASACGRREPPKPGSTTARCTPAGM